MLNNYGYTQGWCNNIKLLYQKKNVTFEKVHKRFKELMAYNFFTEILIRAMHSSDARVFSEIKTLIFFSEGNYKFFFENLTLLKLKKYSNCNNFYELEWMVPLTKQKKMVVINHIVDKQKYRRKNIWNLNYQLIQV